MGKRRGRGKRRGNDNLRTFVELDKHDEEGDVSTKVDKSPRTVKIDDLSTKKDEDVGEELEDVIEVVGYEEISGEEYEEVIVEEIEEIFEVDSEEANEEEVDVGEELYEVEERRGDIDGKTDENEGQSDDEQVEEGQSKYVEEPGSKVVKDDPEEPNKEPVEEHMEDVDEEMNEKTEEKPSENEPVEEVVAVNKRASLNKQEHSEGQATERPGSKVHFEQKKIAESSRSVSSKSFLGSNVKGESYHAHTFSGEKEVGAVVSQIRQDSSNVIALKPSNTEIACGGNSFHNPQANVSSIKRKPSRWDSQLQSHHVTCEVGDEVAKKRKSRWSSDVDTVKVPDLLQIPHFFYDDDKIMQDPEVQELVEELKNINKKFLRVTGVEELRNNEFTIENSITEASLRATFVKQKQQIFSLLLKKGFDFKSLLDGKSSKSKKYVKKMYVPVKEYPDYNFVGLFFGPRGNNHKRMELESGAKIKLRGKGSRERTTIKSTLDQSGEEDLHVLIEADNRESLNSAAKMVEKLLTPVAETENELKRAQLRELAALKGKIAVGELCGVCGDASHYTQYCPLIASAPAGNGHPGGLAEIGAGLSSTSKIDPIDASSRGQLLMGGLSNKKIDERKLFVGQLPFSVDDNRLMELFGQYGDLHEARVVKDVNTGLSQGYAFVKYIHPADAAKAVNHMHGFRLGGRELTVEISGLPAKSPTSTNPKKTTGYQQASQSCLSVLQLNSVPTNQQVEVSLPGSSVPVLNYFSSLSTNVSVLRPATSLYPASTIPSPATTYNSPADLVKFAGNPDKSPSGRLFSSTAANVPRHQTVFGSHAYLSHAAVIGSPSLVRPIAANKLPPLGWPLAPPPAESLHFPGNPDSFSSRFL